MMTIGPHRRRNNNPGTTTITGDQDMNTTTRITIDPWLNRGEQEEALPADVTFVCSYVLDPLFETFEEAVFYREVDGHDELWVAVDPPDTLLTAVLKGEESPSVITQHVCLSLGCSAVAQATDKTDDLTDRLLDALFRSRVGYGWPRKLLGAGLLDAEAVERRVAAIKADLDRIADETSKQETEIVRVARELSLNPRPTGTAVGYWQAVCYGRNHSLDITPVQNAVLETYG
jgi:hypothetical protein